MLRSLTESGPFCMRLSRRWRAGITTTLILFHSFYSHYPKPNLLLICPLIWYLRITRSVQTRISWCDTHSCLFQQTEAVVPLCTSGPSSVPLLDLQKDFLHHTWISSVCSHPLSAKYLIELYNGEYRLLYTFLYICGTEQSSDLPEITQ